MKISNSVWFPILFFYSCSTCLDVPKRDQPNRKPRHVLLQFPMCSSLGPSHGFQPHLFQPWLRHAWHFIHPDSLKKGFPPPKIEPRTSQKVRDSSTLWNVLRHGLGPDHGRHHVWLLPCLSQPYQLPVRHGLHVHHLYPHSVKDLPNASSGHQRQCLHRFWSFSFHYFHR